MSDNEQILVELRKISAWADLQRKATQWLLIFFVVFVPVMILLGVVLDRRIKTTLNDVTPESHADWYDVDQFVRRGQFDEAIQLGEKLIVRMPQSPEAHRRLASAYLAAGMVPYARKHYAETYRLFPSEENEQLLKAIEKRSQSGHLPGDDATNAREELFRPAF